MNDVRYSQGPRIRVAAVIIQNDRLLLVEHEKDGRRNFLLPGGGLDLGETSHEALVRELWEEARLQVSPGPLLFVCESIAPDRSRHVVQLAFAANIVGDPRPQTGEDPRVVGTRFVSALEVLQLPMFPAINQTLHQGLTEGFKSAASVLGNVWKPMK